MAIHLRGVLHGRRLELESDPGLPDGASVEVTIEGEGISQEERSQRLASLAGVWKNDASIVKVFDGIIEERLTSSPRSTDFDAAS